MPIEIRMPALSPTMEKGNLAKWLKKEGDPVKAGDIIAEIETDKATMEVEAVDEGVLAKIVVPEGTADVPVNQLIGVLVGEGEDPKRAAAEAEKQKPEPRGAPPPSQGPRQEAPSQEAAPAGREEASSRSSPPSQPQPAEAPSRGREEQPPRPTAQPHVDGGPGRIFSSPLARRLAKEAGIDLSRVAGTGPHGRVVARDIEAAKSGAGLRPPGPAPAVPSPVTARAPSEEKIRALFEPDSYEIVPHDSMRRIIAQRLTESKLTIPHFYLTIDCAVDRLLAAREEINASAPKDKEGNPAYRLSVNDFVIKALALALQRVPQANVTWTENALLRHKHSDVGVAVAVSGGLITPVVRRAETKSLSAISIEMRDLIARARARKLKPEEYQGGSTAVSNLGMYGIKEFYAVINPPHATILSVGTSEQRAVVRSDRVEVASIMTVGLSTDHRAVDGALGAELLGAFRSFIENPIMMLV